MNMNNIFRKTLKEGFYKNEDFEKHNFQYLNKVLNDFETQNTISVKNGKNIEDKDITYLKGNKYQNHINRFKDWLNDIDVLSDEVGTKNDYLNTLKSTEKTDKEKIDTKNHVLNDFFQSFDIRWTIIEKSDPTIIKTSEQESIQAIFLAAKIEGKTYFNDIHTLYNPIVGEEQERENLRNLFYVNDLGISLANKKIDFSKEPNKKVLKKLANILNMEIPHEFSELKNNFTIIHPDGLLNDVNVDFAKVLFGNGIKWKKVFMGHKYTGSLSKDAFIPADIYIIPLNKIEDLKKMIEAENGEFSPDSIVTLSNNLMKGENNVPLIYPVSLKMSNNPSVHKIENSKKENLIQVGIDNIDSVRFNQTGNSTMEIKYGNDVLVFEFRTKQTGARWQCNAMNKFNKDAIEGGSAKDYMKIIFNDSMDGHITKDDVDEIVKVFGSRIKINEELNLRESLNKNESKILEESFREFLEDESNVDVDIYVKKRSSSLEESFKKFFEDDSVEENNSTPDITANDMVLLAVPDTVAHNNITSSSAKEGNIGLGWFCKKLIDNGIEGSGNNNEALSKIVQLSYKLSEYVQDTWKIM